MVRSTSRLVSGITAGMVLLSVVSLLTVEQAAIAATPNPAKITEAEIRSILSAVLVATEKKDTDGVMRYLAPDATISITVESSIVAPQQLSLSRNEYRQHLLDGFGITQSYSGKLSNLKVQVAPDGESATAIYTLTEETTLKDQPITLTSSSEESVQFKRVKGQTLATAIRSTSRIELKQS